jgi:hypothetical protein
VPDIGAVVRSLHSVALDQLVQQRHVRKRTPHKLQRKSRNKQMRPETYRDEHGGCHGEVVSGSGANYFALTQLHHEEQFLKRDVAQVPRTLVQAPQEICVLNQSCQANSNNFYFHLLVSKSGRRKCRRIVRCSRRKRKNTNP